MSSAFVSPSEMVALGAPNDVINSLWRGLTILELLGTEPEGLLAKTISFRTGLNLGTCYHLLNTLVAAGYVAKQPDTQRFVLTGKLSYPGYTALEGARIVPHIQPHLQALRDSTREAAYLSLRHGSEIVVGAIVDGPQVLRVALLYVGYDTANHAIALGKAILAHLDDHDVALYLDRHGMPAFTGKTICDRATFFMELSAVRQRGYSLDLEEFAPGVCCIAAPVFGTTGRVVASLGIPLPASRYVTDSNALAREVVETAAAASRMLTLLGYAAPTPDPRRTAP